MNRHRFLLRVLILLSVLILAGWTAALRAQSETSQAAPKVAAEQQKQLDQLKQLEDQLAKDRATLHDAIAQHGWDSDPTDAAQEQLFRDREQYRKLRRSLRKAGVAVPPPAGLGPGAGPGPHPGGRAGRGGPYGRRMGQGTGGARPCPCCDM